MIFNTEEFERFRRKYSVDESGCWIWHAYVNPYGYGQFRHKGATRFAHRLSYAHHVGPIPKGMQVCHKCDVRNCINPDHLFVGTPKDNTDDMVRKGRQPVFQGSKNPRSRLNDRDVWEIRSGNKPLAVLAKNYGITESHARKINQGKYWSHL